jgi:hypothetical protein
MIDINNAMADDINKLNTASDIPQHITPLT